MIWKRPSHMPPTHENSRDPPCSHPPLAQKKCHTICPHPQKSDFVSRWQLLKSLNAKTILWLWFHPFLALSQHPSIHWGLDPGSISFTTTWDLSHMKGDEKGWKVDCCWFRNPKQPPFGCIKPWKNLGWTTNLNSPFPDKNPHQTKRTHPGCFFLTSSVTRLIRSGLGRPSSSKLQYKPPSGVDWEGRKISQSEKRKLPSLKRT